MAAMEEAMRRRLLVDGEGIGDDKRLVQLHKMVLKFSEPERTEEETKIHLKKVSSIIDQVQMSMKRATLVSKANDGQIENYRRIFEKIEKEIQIANDQIAQCKQELSEAKQIRKHKQEYDLMAQMIHSHPDRKTLMKDLEKAKEQRSQDDKKREHLEEKLLLRKKQFHVLLLSLQEMQAIIEADEKVEAEAEEMETDT